MTINVSRELLADLLGNDHDKRIMAERNLLAMLANAPSPAGVDGLDGLEVMAYRVAHGLNLADLWHKKADAQLDAESVSGKVQPLCRLSDAQAIIDGLRGEVERLERAEKNDSIAYKAVLERQDELRAELAATKAQGVVIPAELDRAFITGESCDGVYRVVIQSEKLKEMQAVHSWLTSLNAAPAAPAAPAAARPVKVCSECLQQDCNGECISNLD